jgi:hypothetical protein
VWAVRFDAGPCGRGSSDACESTVSMPCAEDLLLLLCVHSGGTPPDKLEIPCACVLLQQAPISTGRVAAGRTRTRRLLEFSLLAGGLSTRRFRSGRAVGVTNASASAQECAGFLR